MKNVLAFVAVIALGTVSYAQMKKPMHAGGEGGQMRMSTRPNIDGCGLGWVVIDSRNMMGTTTRATTNAFVPPTFGMTSGTIGCEQLSIAKNDVESASFVASNYETLKSELAEGRGESVTAALASMGCSAEQVPSVSTEIQKNYDSVVGSTSNATELFNNLKSATAVCGA